MKKLLCFALLLLCAQSSYAQTTVRTPASNATTDRKDDTLIIELTEAPEAAWRHLAQVLVQRGYSIESSSKDLLTLPTHPLLVNNFRAMRVAGMVLNDGTLVIRLYWGGDATSGGVQHVLAQRRFGRQWAELEAVGRDFGGSVRYAANRPD